jgi:hypothetical protein
MDLDIQDSLEEIFKNIKIEVEYLEFRRYEIRIVVDTGEYIITFKYDANLTFEKNIDIIRKEIEKCILDYYIRK